MVGHHMPCPCGQCPILAPPHAAVPDLQAAPVCCPTCGGQSGLGPLLDQGCGGCRKRGKRWPSVWHVAAVELRSPAPRRVELGQHNLRCRRFGGLGTRRCNITVNRYAVCGVCTTVLCLCTGAGWSTASAHVIVPSHRRHTPSLRNVVPHRAGVPTCLQLEYPATSQGLGVCRRDTRCGRRLQARTRPCARVYCNGTFVYRCDHTAALCVA